MAEFTDLLGSIGPDDDGNSEKLLSLVYDELRQLAAAQLSRERPGQTLQATALVHEAYLRVFAGKSGANWENRRHFFAAAGEAMRRILVDRARQKATIKHGGELVRVDLDANLLIDVRSTAKILDLDEALSELESHDASAAELVKLRYFAGLSHQDAAAAMQISRRTADRTWALAKVWLYRRLSQE